MKKKYLLSAGTVVVIATILMLAVTQARSVHSGPQASTSTPSGWPNYLQFDPTNGYVPPQKPTAVQPKVVDLAPDVAYEDKPAVVVQHPDGSREMFLLAPDAVDVFIKKLPKGDTLEGVIPPSSLMKYHQPPPSTYESPTPKVTDLLPNIDNSEKTTIIVQHVDGSEEHFLVLPDHADLFIHVLPTDDRVVQIIPPLSSPTPPY